MQVDRKSIYLLLGVAFLSITVAGWGYYTFFIQRDFIIDSTTICDPQVESCFVWCEDGECESEYYAKITKKAYNIPICNGAVDECEPLVCESEEVGCEITYCSIGELQVNEACTSLRDFQVENTETVSTSTESVI